MHIFNRALLCISVLGAAPAHSAAFSAMERASLRTHALVQKAASQPAISDACKKASDWAAVEPCLQGRKRQLFETPGVKAHKAVAGEHELVAPEGVGAVSAPSARSLPESLPLTPQEQLEISKSQTLRRFENEQKFDVERDLRDFLNTQP